MKCVFYPSECFYPDPNFSVVNSGKGTLNGVRDFICVRWGELFRIVYRYLRRVWVDGPPTLGMGESPGCIFAFCPRYVAA